MRKLTIRVCHILSTVIMIAAITICAAFLIPKLFGYQIFAVLSGSMEPVYHVGSVVYIDTDVTSDEIKTGDAIAFYKESNVIATHRVVEIKEDAQEFVTKGDANQSVDIAPVSFQSLIGRAVFTIPFIGYISVYIKTSRGIIAATGLIIFVILLYAIPSLLQGKREEQENAKKDNI